MVVGPLLILACAPARYPAQGKMAAEVGPSAGRVAVVRTFATDTSGEAFADADPASRCPLDPLLPGRVIEWLPAERLTSLGTGVLRLSSTATLVTGSCDAGSMVRADWARDRLNGPAADVDAPDDRCDGQPLVLPGSSAHVYVVDVMVPPSATSDFGDRLGWLDCRSKNCSPEPDPKGPLSRLAGDDLTDHGLDVANVAVGGERGVAPHAAITSVAVEAYRADGTLGISVASAMCALAHIARDSSSSRKVVNMSFAIESQDLSSPEEAKLFGDVVDAASRKMLLVAGTQNDLPEWPERCETLPALKADIAVVSTDPHDELFRGAIYGRCGRYAAPGFRVRVDRSRTENGASLSAALATGVLAGAWADSESEDELIARLSAASIQPVKSATNEFRLLRWVRPPPQ